MRVNEFEKAILKRGFEPKEVRLEKNQVKWFICGGNCDYDIIVFDKDGKALVLPIFKWEEDMPIFVENYRDVKGKVLGVTINGKPAQRDSRLNLDFTDDTPVSGLYVEETTCPYPERDICDGCPKYIENEGICDMEIPQVWL